jgi:hypothetical protein
VRLPVKSEADAFRLTCGVGLAIGVSVLAAVVSSPTAGIVVFAAIAVAATIRALAAGGPAAAFPAARGGGRDHRVLLVANDAVTAGAVWDRLADRDGRGAVVEVLAPVLQSRTHFVTTDVDRETEAARRRLRTTLRAAHAHGVRAAGRVGDPINPLEALADEVRRYDIDELVVATHRADRRNWLESGILARLGERHEVPLTHVVLDDDGGVIEVHAGA